MSSHRSWVVGSGFSSRTSESQIRASSTPLLATSLQPILNLLIFLPLCCPQLNPPTQFTWVTITASNLVSSFLFLVPKICFPQQPE